MLLMTNAVYVRLYLFIKHDVGNVRITVIGAFVVD